MLPLNDELESCWCQKLTEHIKIILQPKFERNSHLREIFYGTLVFQQSSMICIGCHVGGHTFALQQLVAKTTFCLYLVKRLIVTLKCSVKVTTLSFQHFPWTLSAKFVQKDVIPNFKNHILVTWPATNLLILRKWCGFDKPNHYYFV